MTKPIITALIRYGERFGPYLLFGSTDPEQRKPPGWEIGLWNGEEFALLDGDLFYPTHWHELPDDPQT